MRLRNMMHLTGLFIFLGSLHIAAASTLWEREGVSLEDDVDFGFGDKVEIPDSEPTVVVDVAMPQLKQNEVKMPRKDLALVATQGKVKGGIKDETATTGENAKKKLPASVKNGELSPSSYFHEINHSMISSLSPIDEYNEVD